MSERKVNAWSSHSTRWFDIGVAAVLDPIDIREDWGGALRRRWDIYGYKHKGKSMGPGHNRILTSVSIYVALNRHDHCKEILTEERRRSSALLQHMFSALFAALHLLTPSFRSKVVGKNHHLGILFMDYSVAHCIYLIRLTKSWQK